MVCIYKKNETSFEGNGICVLDPIVCVVSEEAGGEYELHLEHPIDEYGKYKELKEDRIIRAPVPNRTVPSITLPKMKVWRTTQQAAVYSKLPVWKKIEVDPDIQRVREDVAGYAWNVSRQYNRGALVTYGGGIYRAVQYNFAVTPTSTTAVWAYAASTSGSGSQGQLKPGTVIETLESGVEFYKITDYNARYMRVRTQSGNEGYLERSKCEQTDSEQSGKVIPSRTITDQLFRVYSVQGDDSEGVITVSARHISYDFAGNSLMDCKVNEADPMTAISILQGNLVDKDDREIYTNISGKTVTEDWSFVNPINALLDPSSGLNNTLRGALIRDNGTFFFLDNSNPRKGVTLRYGVNLLGATWKKDISNIYTRILPRASAGTDGYVYLDDLYVDSSHIDDHAKPRILVLDCAYAVGETYEKADGTKVKWTEDSIKTQMRKDARARFDVYHVDQPEITLDVNFLLIGDTEEYKQYKGLQKVLLYDEVDVITGPSGMTATAQVTYYEYDCLLGLYNTIRIGEINTFTQRVPGFTMVQGSITASKLSPELARKIQAGKDTSEAAIEETDVVRSEVASADSRIYSEIEQTASSIRSRVTDVETGLHTEILQTACMIMSIVGQKGRNYFQYSDPSGENEIQEGDIWVKTTGVTSHQAAAELTHEELGEYKWAEFYGNEIYMWKGEGAAGHWELIGGDQLSEITHTRIEQTDERIALITDSMSGDYAEFIVEIGRIRSRVQDVEAGLESTIEQTASMIRSAVFTANSEMYSEILQTQSMIRHLVGDYDEEGGLYSLIQQLAGEIRSEVSVKANIYVMWANPASSGYDVKDGDMWVKYFDAVSHAAAGAYSHNQLAEHDWKDFYGHEIYMRKGGAWTKVGGNQLEEMEHTMIEQTDEHVRILAEDMAGHYAEFKVEKTQIRSIVEDKERKLATTITQTAEEVRIDAYNSSSTMFGQLSVRADRIEQRVGDTETGLSTLTTTVEGIDAEVVAARGGKASLKIRVDEISNEVVDARGNFANLKLRADSITSRVGTVEGNYSSIKQKADSIEAEVVAARGGKASLKIKVDEISTNVSTIEGNVSSISQRADSIELSVTNVKEDIKPAKIVASINNGASNILLSADHVSISGSTTLAGTMTISNGSLQVKTAALFGTQTGNQVSINNGSVNAPTLQINSGGKLIIVGSSNDEHYDITVNEIKTMIKSASVSGNTLTLTPFYGDPITFSKATSLSGAWSGGKYIVTAKQGDTTVATHTYAPFLQFSSGGGSANFTAELVDIVGGSTTPQRRLSLGAWLVETVNGTSSTVKINSKSDGTGTTYALISTKATFNSVTLNGLWERNSQSALTGKYRAYTNNNQEVSITPGIRFDGSSDQDYFTASVLTSSSGSKLPISLTGYLAMTGAGSSSAKAMVYATKSGTTYSNPIASLDVGSLYTVTHGQFSKGADPTRYSSESSYPTSGKLNLGAVSKSALYAPGYLEVQAKVHGHTETMYIVINN